MRHVFGEKRIDAFAEQSLIRIRIVHDIQVIVLETQGEHCQTETDRDRDRKRQRQEETETETETVTVTEYVCD
jgi:hypothetical protein